MLRFPLRSACFRISLFIAVAAALLLPPRGAEAAKNVILMVSDGAGYNTWLATSMYQGKVGKQVYDQPEWVSLSCSTYPLNLSGKPTGNLQQDDALVYDPAKAWDSTRTGGKLGSFAGYNFLLKTFTDSAAAATALATGHKTYNSAINWSNDDRPMKGETIAEVAKANGKSVGVITTVQWSHATPAGLGGAHNVSRNAYANIANEMLDSTWLDVIMGAGHPGFDADGQPRDEKGRYQYVGGEKTWSELKAGKRAWKLIERKADFEAMGAGPTPPKVLGTVQVASTLQQGRKRGQAKPGAAAADPYADPLNANVPSLAVMTRAAINCLDDNKQGFYLMIEGGCIDGANHMNQPDRMIEEQEDFLKAIEAVVAWVEANSNWNDTLLILTADHDCGLLWGPNSSKVAFDPLEDRGQGKLPGMKYLSHSHSNSLVPLYARGAGSEQLVSRVIGDDVTAASQWNVSGKYIDNTDVGAVMQAEVGGVKKAKSGE
jgi:alkaline phosphatase